ncbi:DUF456 domain-containing protein [Variovorax sp. YR752]|uniref:DUF456 domain-containing protein n=1 Tax=Variovorax sp. YR752 TaxID=1884383 RepID=UPI0031383F86
MIESVTLVSASPWWWLLAISLMAVGLAGVILPVLPGAILVLAGAALGAWIDGFAKVSGWTVGVIAVLAVLAWATDYVAALLGAKKAGASPAAVAGAAIGTVLGILMGFVGLLFMPLVGAAAGEYWHQQRRNGGFASAADHAMAGRQAARVGVATWIGQLLGTVVKVVLVFLMIGVFAVAYMV